MYKVRYRGSHLLLAHTLAQNAPASRHRCYSALTAGIKGILLPVLARPQPHLCRVPLGASMEMWRSFVRDLVVLRGGGGGESKTGLKLGH